MLRRRPGAARLRGVALCGLVLALAGCGTGPVEIPAGDLSEADRHACRALVDDLPAAIGDRERDEVTPSDALGAAWGDPPIVLRCGVDVPDSFGRTAVCQEANGVGWYVALAALDDATRDVTMTTVGYRPIVEVVVPADQRPEGVASAMATLAGPVERHTELVRPCV